MLWLNAVRWVVTSGWPVDVMWGVATSALITCAMNHWVREKAGE